MKGVSFLSDGTVLPGSSIQQGKLATVKAGTVAVPRQAPSGLITLQVNKTQACQAFRELPGGC